MRINQEVTENPFIGDCKRFLEFETLIGGGSYGQGVPINNGFLSIYSENLGVFVVRLNEIIKYVQSYRYTAKQTSKST